MEDRYSRSPAPHHAPAGHSRVPLISTLRKTMLYTSPPSRCCTASPRLLSQIVTSSNSMSCSDTGVAEPNLTAPERERMVTLRTVTLEHSCMPAVLFRHTPSSAVSNVLCSSSTSWLLSMSMPSLLGQRGSPRCVTNRTVARVTFHRWNVQSGLPCSVTPVTVTSLLLYNLSRRGRHSPVRMRSWASRAG